jgi:single-stranded DNA-binding protein
MNPQLVGVGRVVRDPSIHIFEDSGAKVANFTLVFNKRKKKGEETVEESVFLDFQVWDSAANVFEQYVKQGNLIQFFAEPRVKSKKRDDGSYDNRISFRITTFELLGGGKKQEVETTEKDSVDVNDNKVAF